jgi:hypothetical protein
VTSHLAVSWPEPKDVGEVAKTTAAVAGILGGILALARRVWRRRKAEREVRALEAKALRYTLDAVRHALDVMTPSSDGRMTNLTELQRQLVLVNQVRRDLWAADGNELPEDAPAEVMRNFLTRTQAIQRLREKQDMFKDGDQR